MWIRWKNGFLHIQRSDLDLDTVHIYFRLCVYVKEHIDTFLNNLIQMSALSLALQTVDMHREKVARREIGVFTTAKRVPRSHKVIPPATGKEPKTKYARTPISYAGLDSIGHGMKVRDLPVCWLCLISTVQDDM